MDCKFKFLKKNDPRGWSAPTRANIHVLYHNIQRSSFLKLLGMANENHINMKHLYEEETKM